MERQKIIEEAIDLAIQIKSSAEKLAETAKGMQSLRKDLKLLSLEHKKIKIKINDQGYEQSMLCRDQDNIGTNMGILLVLGASMMSQRRLLGIPT